MLTEHIVASISKADPDNHVSTKDTGIFLYEVRPHAVQRNIYKKSVTAPNSLTVTSSHIFAVQEGKAVVHVYGRVKGSLEMVVPFPELLCSMKLAMQDTLAVLGTAKGRILLWEICTGRLVSTSQSHLKPVTLLAVDPSSCFLLSGSADATVLVWSFPGLLSFDSASEDRKPLRAINEHRSELTALAVGHSSFSANIAISADKDGKAVIWNHQSGKILRIILLQPHPLSLVLDPADRVLYASFANGSVQVIDFFSLAASKHVTPSFDIIHNERRGPLAALQPGPDSVISAPSQDLGSAHSLTLSWDATTLLSGHESGKVVVWDIAHRMYTSLLSILPGPVTNLIPLSPTGFAIQPASRSLEIHSIIKPKPSLGSRELGSDTSLPAEYTMSNRFPSTIPLKHDISLMSSMLEQFFSRPGIPQAALDQNFVELGDFYYISNTESTIPAEHARKSSEADFVPLSDEIKTSEDSANEITSLQERNKNLQAQLEALQRLQKVTFAQMTHLRNKENPRETEPKPE